MFMFLKPMSGFRRNVLTLMTGTIIAQAIPIAVSPLLTRLYTPDDFGTLTLFVSIFAILSAISTFRYELAIVQPDRDEDAAAILALSLSISACLGVFLMLITLVFGEHLVSWLGIKGGAWMYFIPICVFVGGAIQAIGYWHSRHQRFKRLSHGKIAQGIGTVAIQCGAAIGPLGLGLIIGYVGGLCISLYALCRGVWKKEKAVLSNLSVGAVRRNARTYINYPKYSIFGALADNVSLHMPVFMLTKFFDVHATGSFGLTFRILNLPLTLVASSFSQVLYQKLAVMQNSQPEAMRGMIVKIFMLLLGAMVPVIWIVMLFSEPLFAFVFGEPWRAAGSMASILVIAVAIRFAVNPLSCVLALNQNIRLGVLWQTLYLITITITLYAFRNESLDLFLKVFVAHEVILYSLYFCFILKGAKLRKKN